MIVHDTERVRSSHSLFLWTLGSFADYLAELAELVRVVRIPYECVFWILSDLAVLQEFTCFFIEDRQSKILKNSGRVTARSCYCQCDNIGLALEPLPCPSGNRLVLACQRHGCRLSERAHAHDDMHLSVYNPHVHPWSCCRVKNFGLPCIGYHPWRWRS